MTNPETLLVALEAYAYEIRMDWSMFDGRDLLSFVEGWNESMRKAIKAHRPCYAHCPLNDPENRPCQWLDRPAPAQGQPCPLGEPDDGFAPGCEVCHREPCPARLRPYSLIAAGRAIPPEEPAPAQGQRSPEGAPLCGVCGKPMVLHAEWICHPCTGWGTRPKQGQPLEWDPHDHSPAKQGQPPLCKCGHTVTEHIGGAHWPLIPVGSQIGHDEPFYGYCTHGDVIDKCKCTRFRPKQGQPREGAK